MIAYEDWVVFSEEDKSLLIQEENRIDEAIRNNQFIINSCKLPDRIVRKLVSMYKQGGWVLQHRYYSYGGIDTGEGGCEWRLTLPEL